MKGVHLAVLRPYHGGVRRPRLSWRPFTSPGGLTADFLRAGNRRGNCKIFSCR